MEPFDVHFDSTCRFASRLRLWLGKLDVEANWLPFSLLEAKRDGDGRRVWEDPDQADNISLLMLAGHELVRDRGGDTAGYRRHVFAAWHGGDQRLDADSVLVHAADAGVDAGVDALHEALAMVGDHHRTALERGVLGSSTTVFRQGVAASCGSPTFPTSRTGRPSWRHCGR